MTTYANISIFVQNVPFIAVQFGREMPLHRLDVHISTNNSIFVRKRSEVTFTWKSCFSSDSDDLLLFATKRKNKIEVKVIAKKKVYFFSMNTKLLGPIGIEKKSNAKCIDDDLVIFTVRKMSSSFFCILVKK